MVPLFWDCDLCNFTEVIKKASEPTSRLDEIRDIPHNLRLFWGHLLDFMNRSFNEPYVERWANHYGALFNYQNFEGEETFASIANSTAARNTRAMADMIRDIPEVEFAITTNDGQAVTVDTPSIVLNGKGWVNIRQIRLAGTDHPLDVFWPEADGWQVELALAGGTEEIRLEAIDYQGNLIATDSITVHSANPNPVLDSLRITEVQYNPAPPSAGELGAGFDNDDFEYIELTNIGQQTISLAGVQLVRSGDAQQGVAFDFATGSVQELAPGQAIVVVEDRDAIRLRYGAATPIAGQWSGGLGNDAETITLVVGGTVIHQFTYEDNWYDPTDGDGRALQIINAYHPDLASWSLASSWRPSATPLGTPGATEALPGDANHDAVFNSADLVVLLQSNEYEDGISGNSQFEEGDFNGDGDFTTNDFVWAFQYAVYEVSPANANANANARRTHALAGAALDQVSKQHGETGSTRPDEARSALPSPRRPLARKTPIEPLAADAIFRETSWPADESSAIVDPEPSGDDPFDAA
jgi:hypothetical protein